MLRFLQQLRSDQKLVETHASWVLVSPRFVYKMKKPLNLGFLDFSTLEKRYAACQSELSLNDRLARDVYLQVVPIRRAGDAEYIDDDDVQKPAGASGQDAVVEWAVKMRRLSDSGRGDVLLRAGQLGQRHIERIAQLLVSFHGAVAVDESMRGFGSSQLILNNVRENFDQAAQLSRRYISACAEAAIEEYQLQFLVKNEELFQSRIRQGRIREGHGDLRLEHLYFEGNEISIIDCIEFNERFRFGDVAADLAFLVMDLRHQGADDFAELLISGYARQSGDYEIYRLIDFYEAYRAYVRAKVTAFRQLQEEEHPSVFHFDGQRLAAQARRYFLHAHAVGRPTSTPAAVIAVGGMIASGKTTWAARLGRRLCCPVIDSDSTRKRLAGLAPTQSAVSAPFEGIYDKNSTQRVYECLVQQAGWVLESGRRVIVEASFRTVAQRQRLAELAERCGVAFSFIWCEAPREVVVSRLVARENADAAVSDGRVAILDSLENELEPFDASAYESSVVLDTSLSEEELGARLATLGF
jgi:hypothetical protein